MKAMTKKHVCFAAVLLFSVCINAGAQDTLKLTLPEAENLFLQRNLALLAEKFNIDIARAQIVQAKLFNNPNFQFTGAIYNPEQKKGLDVSNRTGEYIVGAQQLILLAGKRNKQIRLAEINAALSENRFFDLLRTLRYALRSNFFQLYYLQNSFTAYQKQIGYLERLNAAYQELLGKGVVTLKDAVRIQSLLYSLRAEQTGLQNQMSDLNAELQLLVQNNAAVIRPLFTATEKGLNIRDYPLVALYDTAFANRQDLKLAQNVVLYNQQNYALQKALATPDLTLGAQFDKRGSYVDNASFFTAAIDLPFFNRNQGNIKAARVGMEQSKTLVQGRQNAIQNEVQRAYVKLLNTDNMLRSFDPAFRGQLDKLLQGITENFQKRNISLLEFTDFYESYKASILQFNNLQSTRQQAVEDLHFALGKTIF